MPTIATIRTLLNEQPSLDVWQALVRTLEDWQDTETLELALEYCKSHIQDWPQDLATFASTSWFKRDPKQIKADPRTDFFVYAFQARSEYFPTWAKDFLAAEKPGIVPKFIDLDALGKMRWRTGEAFEEDDKKRLITLLKNQAKEMHVKEVEWLRQLLNDTDCQRWCQEIYGAWAKAGARSPHNWSRSLIAYFGNIDHYVVKEQREMQLYLDCATTHAMLAAEAFEGSLTRVGPYRAYDSLAGLARGRGLNPQTFIQRLSPTFQQSDKSESALLKAITKSQKCSPKQRKTWATLLHDAMRYQRDLGYNGRFVEIVATTPLQTVLAPVVWRAQHDQDETFFRWAEDGLITVDGQPFAPHRDATITVAHPAGMQAKTLSAWQTHLQEAKCKPIFEQLDRPIHKTPIATSGTPITADLTFFFECGWTIDNRSTGCEYATSTVFLDPIHNWRIEVDLSYKVELRGGYANNYGGAPTLGATSLQGLFGGYDPSQDPIACSEAYLEVERLVAAAGALGQIHIDGTL